MFDRYIDMRRTLLYLPVLLLLTTCVIDEQGTNLSQTETNNCEESDGQYCLVDDSNINLELIIQTPNPIITLSANGDCNGNSNRDITGALITGSNNFCFDVSGLCNEGGLDLAFIIAKTSLDGFSNSFNLGSCKRGKFHVQLRVQLIVSGLCKLHTLQLELIGKKIDGTEVLQPAKARKTIGFQVSNHEECT